MPALANANTLSTGGTPANIFAPAPASASKAAPGTYADWVSKGSIPNPTGGANYSLLAESAARGNQIPGAPALPPQPSSGVAGAAGGVSNMLANQFQGQPQGQPEPPKIQGGGIPGMLQAQAPQQAPQSGAPDNYEENKMKYGAQRAREMQQGG